MRRLFSILAALILCFAGFGITATPASAHTVTCYRDAFFPRPVQDARKVAASAQAFCPNMHKAPAPDMHRIKVTIKEFKGYGRAGFWTTVAEAKSYPWTGSTNSRVRASIIWDCPKGRRTLKTVAEHDIYGPGGRLVRPVESQSITINCK